MAGEHYPVFGTQTTAMIENTIGKIEARIQGSDAIKAERRQELLQLLMALQSH